MKPQPRNRIRASFAAAATGYNRAASLQREVANTLIEHLPHPPSPPGLVVDAGCGTVYVASQIQGRYPDAGITALDFALPMLQSITCPTLIPVGGGQENLPFAADSTDLYISSLSLQWCTLEKALAEAWRVLKPGGLLAFSTLCAGTFEELTSAFARVDKHPHALNFLASEEITQAASRAGFVRQTHLQETHVAHYPTLRELLQAIRDVGAHQIGNNRRKGLLSPRGLGRVELLTKPVAKPTGYR